MVDKKEGVMQEKFTCSICGYQIDNHTLVKSEKDVYDKSSKSIDECAWEERREGRKTILSSTIPRTDKPLFASIFLIVVVIIGLSSAIFPEAYLQAPLDVLFAAGLTGTITITIQNQSGIPLENMYIWVDSLSKRVTDSNGTTTINNVPLAKQLLHVSSALDNSSGFKEFFFLPIHSYYNITVTNQSGNLRIIDKSTNLAWCSSIVLLLSVVCLFGFIAAWKRQYFDVALVGGIIGLGIFGFYFVGTILSVIALLLLIKSKEEFKDEKKGKNF